MESATLTRLRPPQRAREGVEDAPPRGDVGRFALPAFVLLCAGAFVAFLVYPTYPNYDSYYSLLWGRELLDGQLPSFEAYRAPTPHPLALFAGAVLSPLGHGAERIWILLCVAAFVALVAGVYRLARVAFTPLVGFAAGALVLSRFDFGFYAARGYIDIAYMAVVVWAAALEAERPRRGVPVLVLLAVAGLLRPEAWLMSGLYWLWLSWRATWGERLRWAAIAAIGPVVWAGIDFAVTGDALWSLTYTSAFAEELGRAKEGGALLPSLWEFLVKLDKLPVVAGGLIGLALAIAMVPRRSVIPLTLLGVGVGTFLIVGLAGFSVIDRYLLVSSMVLIVFCAVALAGWTMLREDSRVRRAWAIGAGLLVLAGVAFTATRVDLDRIEDELVWRGNAHAALHDVLDAPAVQAGLRCGPVSTPNHKLIPDVRWILDRGEGGVVARSNRAKRARRQRGVAIYVHERVAIFKQALVSENDDTFTQLPVPGYDRAAVSRYYSAYVRC